MGDQRTGDLLVCRRVTRNCVRLSDGTAWMFDLAEDDETSLEWILRYGSTEQREHIRYIVASILSTCTALLYRPQRRRNEVCSAIRRALDSGGGPGREGHT